ncbi:phosphate signaling complex protein PhoU [Flaviflexus salsibiostraticola]|uniref:Phosphate-specific transport system accessory protein PhoU n=1 Tax=Flaviflexus salsibiostraticola TaxID=1282737 RepID=A0A3S8ZAI2_9ACTO|nr:phosphate signaling complex protein PhoU [Flaviflexus salsibiostraticola]AZN30477.1 phosphate signaling complex protein PhoU [Flaviflexus salsibiostraticola]
MREIFRQEMQQLGDDLLKQGREAARSMERATQSLKDANIALAEQVIDADKRIDALERNLDEMGISVLARQAPVAADLRTVVSVLRISSTLERMGDLARHVAYVARGRYPERVNSGPIYDLLVEMAEHATVVGQRVAQLLDTHDLSLAEMIEEEDNVLDALHHKSFSLILDESLDLSRQEIIDAVLLARYMERFGDHGVSIARRITFLVTGHIAERDETIREIAEAAEEQR